MEFECEVKLTFYNKRTYLTNVIGQMEMFSAVTFSRIEENILLAIVVQRREEGHHEVGQRDHGHR